MRNGWRTTSLLREEQKKNAPMGQKKKGTGAKTKEQREIELREGAAQTQRTRVLKEWTESSKAQFNRMRNEWLQIDYGVWKKLIGAPVCPGYRLIYKPLKILQCLL